jgi:uncharacterized cupin superfamily protein
MHRDDMESFYVLEGELRIYVDGKGVSVPAGSFALSSPVEKCPTSAG